MDHKTVSNRLFTLSTVIIVLFSVLSVLEIILGLNHFINGYWRYESPGLIMDIICLVLTVIVTLFIGWVWSNIFSGFASIVLSTGESASALKENNKLLSEIESKTSSVNNDKSSSYTNDDLPTM